MLIRHTGAFIWLQLTLKGDPRLFKPWIRHIFVFKLAVHISISFQGLAAMALRSTSPFGLTGRNVILRV
jgi:hypothetical protein